MQKMPQRSAGTRNRRARALLPLAVASLIAGCAAPGPDPATRDAARAARRIGVVSVAADRLDRQFVGLVVFGNQNESRPIEAWNVDAAWQGQMADALTRLGLEAVQAPYPRDAFVHANDLRSPWDAPAFWGPDFDAVRQPVRELCQANHLDAVAVLARATYSDTLGGTNQVLRGASIYAHMSGPARLHLSARVALMSCASGEVIGKPQTLPQTAFLMVPEPLAKTPFAQWTEADERTVHEALVRLPESYWAGTLGAILGR